MNIYVKKQGRNLYIMDDDAISQIPDQSEFIVKMWKPRNLKLHKKFMAILDFVVHNSRWADKTSLLNALKFELGLVDHVVDLHGNDRIVPRSIAFDSMDEIEFKELMYKPAIELLSKEVGLSKEQLEDAGQNYQL